MGQRSQVYIVMDNIGKTYFDALEINKPEKWQDNVAQYVEVKEKYDNWVKTYGKGKKIVVGFYHQWMYGRAFVQIATMLFTMFKHLNEKDKESPNYSENPFNGKAYKKERWGHLQSLHKVSTSISLLQSYISILFDLELGQYSRLGIENFTLMNGDWNQEPFTRFDEIDNNDGVLIFDVTSNKYCFSGVSNYTDPSLKYLVPIGAEKYIRSYYQESVEDFTPDELEDMTKESLEKEKNKFVLNKEINKKFLDRLEGAELLTPADLIKLFPEMEDDIKNANNL